MIKLQVNGYGTFDMAFTEGMTAQTLIDNFKNEQRVTFQPGNWTLQNALDAGRIVSPSEKLMDGKLYVLTTMIGQSGT